MFNSINDVDIYVEGVLLFISTYLKGIPMDIQEFVFRLETEIAEFYFRSHEKYPDVANVMRDEIGELCGCYMNEADEEDFRGILEEKLQKILKYLEQSESTNQGMLNYLCRKPER